MMTGRCRKNKTSWGWKKARRLLMSLFSYQSSTPRLFSQKSNVRTPNNTIAYTRDNGGSNKRLRKIGQGRRGNHVLHSHVEYCIKHVSRHGFSSRKVRSGLLRPLVRRGRTCVLQLPHKFHDLFRQAFRAFQFRFYIFISYSH